MGDSWGGSWGTSWATSWEGDPVAESTFNNLRRLFIGLGIRI